MMKVRDIAIFAFVLCFMGCGGNMAGSLYKPGVGFTKPMKIAVAKFKITPQQEIGQEAADLMAMAFFKKGFDVVDMNQVLSPVEQSQIYDTGLSAEAKAKLKNYGITAVLFGTITEFRCSPRFPMIRLTEDGASQVCQASFSSTMIDVTSGEILWGLSSSDTMTDAKLKAGTVLRTMIRELDKEIPIDLSKQTNK
ncbi:MAG: hypothetical protein CSYNP_02462 [Syntrophus sp. SKADARSKE-3]|nr:hypothetical protein [Syntrophus sp. SKADARSKE-3]